MGGRLGLIVCMDEAAEVAQAIQKCEFGSKGRRAFVPSGAYAHLTDALGYALYWATPRPMTRSFAPPSGSILPLTMGHSGPRIL